MHCKSSIKGPLAQSERSKYNKMKFLIVVIAVAYLSLGSQAAEVPLVYTKCGLVREMLRNGFNFNDMQDWACLAERTSNYTINKVDRENQRFGNFQLEYYSWCGQMQKSGKCKALCSDFLKNNFNETFRCVKLAHKDYGGFTAFKGWREHCNDGKPKPTITECSLDG